MVKIISFSALAFALASLPAFATTDHNIPLAAGTLIRCVVSEPDFSPTTVNKGDPLVCYARPFHEFACSAFPAGTQISGRLVDYRKPGRFFGKGWMELKFNRLILPVGETEIDARVTGVQGFKVDRKGRILGHGHPVRDAIGWMIPFLWPIKVLTLPMRGPEPALKGEQAVTLRLMDDITLPCEGILGTVLSPYTSSLIEPYSGQPILPSFRALEKQASEAFRAWKPSLIVDEPPSSTVIMPIDARATDNLFPPRPGPEVDAAAGSPSP